MRRALFKNKTVAVLGYGNGAARGVLYLANICEKVHLLTPKVSLMAEAVYLERIGKLTNFTATYGAEVVRIVGNDVISGVEFTVGETPRSLKVEGVFVEMGMEPNTELAGGLGLEMTKGGYIKVNRLNQETSMPGVFAAGDVAGGKMQVTTAVGSGTTAAISAMQYLG